MNERPRLEPFWLVELSKNDVHIWSSGFWIPSLGTLVSISISVTKASRSHELGGGREHWTLPSHSIDEISTVIVESLDLGLYGSFLEKYFWLGNGVGGRPTLVFLGLPSFIYHKHCDSAPRSHAAILLSDLEAFPEMFFNVDLDCSPLGIRLQSSCRLYKG